MMGREPDAGSGNGRPWYAAIVVSIALFVAAATAAEPYDYRDFTPSGTQIRSQASATFLDSADVRRQTLSNVVVTVVQSVTGVRLTPEGESAAARSVSRGGQAVFPFIVTNSGNESATFTVTAVLGPDAASRLGTPIAYRDENCNGRLDAGEASSDALDLSAGDTACVVLVATALANAPVGDASVMLTVAAPDDDGAPTVVANELMARGATATVTVTDAAVLTAFLHAEPSAVVTPGGSVTLTATVSNTSGVPAYAAEIVGLPGEPQGIFVAVELPGGLQLLSSNDVVVSSGVAADDLVVYAGGPSASGGVTWQALSGGAALPAQISHVGVLVPGVAAFYPSGAQTLLSVTLTEASDGGAGSAFVARASVSYGSDATSSVLQAQSNDVIVSKGRAADVMWDDASLSSVSSSDGGAGAGAAPRTVTGLRSGVTLTLRDALRNAGNASERYHLDVLVLAAAGDGSATSSENGAWLCRVYQSDGVTPIGDAVGPVAAGATLTVVTRCDVPTDPEVAAPSVIRLNARTVNDPTVDASVDWSVPSVSEGFAAGYGVVNPIGAVTSVADGGVTSIVLRLTNDGVNPDTFDLAASTADQAAWLDRVALYLVGPVRAATEACPTGTAELAAARSGVRVANSGIINPGMARCVLADVTALRGAVAGERTITFSSASTTRSTLAISASASITVAQRSGLQFTPDRSATITSGGSVNVNHTLRNTGNSAGSVTIAAPVVEPADSARVLYSVDGVTFSTAVTDLELAPGEDRAVIVRVIAAAGQPVGRRIAVTPTATISYGPAHGTLSRSLTNTYDVIDGVLRLDLRVANCGQSAPAPGAAATCSEAAGDAALPRDHLRYTLSATNLGAAPVREVVVTEPLPAFTDFVAITATSSFGGQVEYSLDGQSWASSVSGVTSGSVIYVRFVSGGSDVPIPPAGTVTVTLTVRVR